MVVTVLVTYMNNSEYPIVSLKIHSLKMTGIHFFERVGDKIQIVGDDLTVTNPTRIKTAIERKPLVVEG